MAIFFSVFFALIAFAVVQAWIRGDLGQPVAAAGRYLYWVCFAASILACGGIITVIVMTAVHGG